MADRVDLASGRSGRLRRLLDCLLVNATSKSDLSQAS
jgi:hypothetical protein